MLKICLVVILLLLSLCSSVGQSFRKALVIGNESYRSGLPLFNPANDANAMEAVLKEAGFTVMKYLDMERESMESAIENFGENIKGSGVALVFYAGHGLQYNGNNWLVPVDANLKSEADIPGECVAAEKNT